MAVETDKFGKRRKVCQNPKLSVSGGGKLGILIIREQPTQINDATADWLTTAKGRSLLGIALHNVGIDMQEDCWTTGAAICYGKNHSSIPIECCRPHLLETIKELQPKVIMPVGVNAAQSVLSHLWREGSGDMSRFCGYQIPVKKWNAWVCPVFDSAYILSLGNRFVDKGGRKPDVPQGLGGVAFLWLCRHIEAMAEKLPNRPNFGNTKEQITLLYNANGIADVLERIGNSEKGWAAFDYETNCLKPEVDGARVLCASVCLGGWNKVMITVSFPMSGAIRESWVRFLQSPVPKIAQNLKMEDRWSRVYFKTEVTHWAVDTMLNAHILNCAKGDTGLKFQAFANFGEAGYDDVTGVYMSNNSYARGGKREPQY
jgi:uracil-DNA glycosylase family 4